MVSATFGFTSLTNLPLSGATTADVTTLIKSRLDRELGILKLNASTNPGFVEQLKRESGQDAVRTRMRQGINRHLLGVQGSDRVLKIHYRGSKAEPDPEVYLPRVSGLLHCLRKYQKTQTRTEINRERAAPFTW